MPNLQRLADRMSARTTVVSAGSASFGDGGFTLIGGPCCIESSEQIEAAAAGVARAGGAMLRGGAYKPRTSPYDFQGLGDAGLPLIAEAGGLHGLPVVVEALAESHVALVAAYADMLQIGARNMQNVPLLRTAARTGLPILLKRGPSATLDELLFAAEYILVEGNSRIVLCERGIRGFDPNTRNVCDLAGALRLKELTHLPVILDPSHASGRRTLIEPLTLAAAAAGLDGAIVESHPHPSAAMCDAAQAIDLTEFAQIARRVRVLRSALADDVAPELVRYAGYGTRDEAEIVIAR
ncbi:MAG: 3-deoxy-7-phosphoheptulonate synthase [Candidatus Eremiobacteraeota bacterium]|nr:3-deoxy-7-phosphoheptulonate synthase [Candidatus Eremiobacteraeota bacterium]